MTRSTRIALERSRARRAVRRRCASALFVLVLAAIWGLWEGYRWLWIHQGWTWPFVVDDISMPPLQDIFGALFDPAQVNGPLLIDILWHAALFTAKEAAVGFAIGAAVGFALGVVLAHFNVLQRGLLPYIVASQTIPIIAIAPMVVVGLGSYDIPAWFRVAVIAAYLTFFPVTVNTIRGLQSVDPHALELMHSYAAGKWAILWKLRVPAALPYLFSAFKIAATASVVGAIIGEAAVVDSGRPRRRDHQLQPVLHAQAREPVGDERDRGRARDHVLPRRRRRREARGQTCAGASRMTVARPSWAEIAR